MFLLADEKKAEPMLGELSWFRQQELDCTCPVYAVVALQPSCCSSKTDFYTLTEGLLWPKQRENAAVFQSRGKLFRQRGVLFLALGTLSSQLLSLSKTDGLQQFPVLKTRSRKKPKMI